MIDETTLLSCPFCEGETELKEYKPNVSGVAICKECGARSPICKNDHTGGWRPKAIAAWNTRTHGTLTAEQVRRTVAKHWQESKTRHDWQAIADELNAELGSGTCEFVECGICKFYHADIQLCEYGIPPCSKFERKAVTTDDD